MKLTFKRNPRGSDYLAIDGDRIYRCHDTGELKERDKIWVASVQDNDPIINDTDEEAPWVQINYCSTYLGAKELCQEHAEKNK
jgi:hypothetical protein